MRVAVLAVAVLTLPIAVLADWSPTGTFLMGAYANDAGAVSDDAGGTIVVMIAAPDHIYAQRFDARGNPMWPGENGVEVCVAGGSRGVPGVISDGEGGVIAAWIDSRYGSAASAIYAQRVDASGTPLWVTDGVEVGAAPNGTSLVAGPLRNGVFTLAWQQDGDVRVQQVGYTGNPLWSETLGASAETERDPVIVWDGNLGAYVAWVRETGTSSDIELRGVEDGGFALDLITVCDATGTQDSVNMIRDPDTGDYILVWADYRFGFRRIYGQRVEYSTENFAWTTNGVHIGAGGGDEVVDIAGMVSDGEGGALLSWWQTATSGNYDMRLLRLTASGAIPWSSLGIPLSPPQPSFGGAAIAAVDGGAVVAWESDTGQFGIQAQRVDLNGNPLWGDSSIGLSEPPLWNSTTEIKALVPDGRGGVVGVYGDDPDFNSQRTIHGQRRHLQTGHWGHPEPEIVSVVDTPDDQGGSVTVNWLASDRDNFTHDEILSYSLWRAVDALPSAATATAPRVVSLEDLTEDFTGPAYRVEQTASGEYYWEWVGTTTAAHLSGYSEQVATRDDSTGAGPALHQFQVVAQGFSANYASLPAGGYSVDNLAPAAPTLLAAARVGNYVRLDWTPGSGEPAPDFSQYAIYRSGDPELNPEPAYFLTGSQDTTLWDRDAVPGASYYYIVTAVDLNDNQSEPSNLAFVGGTTTGVGDTPGLTALQVRSNVPNPFGASTDIRVGIPDAADVSVEFFDVRGRRVAAVSAPHMAAGWNTIRFDGRDDTGALLPTGVYFYRVNAAGSVETRKLILMR